jgi:uncharacterized protein with HEPN domain
VDDCRSWPKRLFRCEAIRRRRADRHAGRGEDAAEIVKRGRSAFDADRILQRTAKNLVAELGEAAKAVPDGVAARIPDVPWRAIRGMREKVVHDYPELDLEVVHAGR